MYNLYWSGRPIDTYEQREQAKITVLRQNNEILHIFVETYIFYHNENTD